VRELEELRRIMPGFGHARVREEEDNNETEGESFLMHRIVSKNSSSGVGFLRDEWLMAMCVSCSGGLPI